MTCRRETKIPNSSSHPSYGVLEKACGGRISQLLQLGMYSVAQSKSTVRLQGRYVIKGGMRVEDARGEGEMGRREKRRLSSFPLYPSRRPLRRDVVIM